MGIVGAGVAFQRHIDHYIGQAPGFQYIMLYAGLEGAVENADD